MWPQQFLIRIWFHSTQHIVPGIDFSDDPLLAGRNFSYFECVTCL